jgi:threonine/homoserine/homoserine lactone efflux protein
MPPELPAILIAALTGFGFGFLVSIPVGPVNLGIMNEGAQRGFKYGALIGVGASIMEFIYCALAFTGFSSFFQTGYVKAVMEVFSFAFMIFLGMKFLLASSIHTPGRMEKHIQGKLHPSSPFMKGFVMVLGNPGVLLGWIVLSAYFMSRDWVQPNTESKGACTLGVMLGTSAWFTGLAYAASLGHKKFSEKTLLRMERGSGISLLALGFVQGCHIAWQLVKHKL